MTHEEKNSIREQALGKLKLTNTSQATAARQIPMSDATLSNILGGKWENISDEMWRKLGRWCGFTSREWAIKNSRNLDLIVKLCSDAQLNSRFLAVAGFTGGGKTTALKHYANTTPGVFYVLCTVTMSRKDFLTAIQRSLGLDNEGSIHARTASIVRAFSAMNRPLLLLDDAGKLNDQCMRLIQVIYDELEFSTGIVLGGTEKLKTHIDRSAALDRPGFRELRRRIGYWQKLYPISRQFISAVCADFGITDAKAVELVARMATDFGTLRELMTNWSRAESEADQVTVLSSLTVGNQHYNDSKA